MPIAAYQGRIVVPLRRAPYDRVQLPGGGQVFAKNSFKPNLDLTLQVQGLLNVTRLNAQCFTRAGTALTERDQSGGSNYTVGGCLQGRFCTITNSAGYEFAEYGINVNTGSVAPQFLLQANGGGTGFSVSNTLTSDPFNFVNEYGTKGQGYLFDNSALGGAFDWYGALCFNGVFEYFNLFQTPISTTQMIIQSELLQTTQGVTNYLFFTKGQKDHCKLVKYTPTGFLPGLEPNADIDSVTLDDAVLNTALESGGSSSYGSFVGGFQFCLGTGGLGPSGRPFEPIILSADCTRYWLVYFDPRDATTAAALADMTGNWQWKIDTDGTHYFQQTAVAYNVAVFFSDPLGVSYQSPPTISFAMPCYITCEPYYRTMP